MPDLLPEIKELQKEQNRDRTWSWRAEIEVNKGKIKSRPHSVVFDNNKITTFLTVMVWFLTDVFV